MRHTLVVMLLVICGTVAVRGQQSVALPRFDVASVKESFDSPTAAPSETPNGVNYQSVPLSWLMSRAFAIPEREIVGGPDWIRTRRFNITARTGAEVKSRAEFPPMLQALLQDRFGLEFERVQEERPVYALVVARTDGRLGPRLKPSTSSCTSPGAFPSSAFEYKKGANGNDVLTLTRCGISYAGSAGQFGPQVSAVSASRVVMAEFVSLLTNVLDRPVTDRTALTGEFDFVVLPSDVLSASPSPSADAPAGNQKLFVAVEDQLGLKLQPARAPVDVLRILQVRPPTEN